MHDDLVRQYEGKHVALYQVRSLIATRTLRAWKGGGASNSENCPCSSPRLHPAHDESCAGSGDGLRPTRERLPV
jgi:hypothetical protein